MPDIFDVMGLMVETDRRPYCLRFTNFHPRTLAATQALFDAHPYRQDDDTKKELFEQWIAAICAIYSIPVPTLAIADGLIPPHALGVYTPDDATVHLTNYSIITLFHEFRHHMQATGHGVAGEPDARGWSASLFFTVKPRLFLNSAKRGLIVYT